MNRPVADPAYRHRKHRPLKEGGVESRRLLWDTLDWSQFDAVLARKLGVHSRTVGVQRRKRGIAPRPRGGKRVKLK